MPRNQNYADLSKGRTASSIKEPGIRFCTHTCPLPRSHVQHLHIFSNAGSSATRHNNDAVQHPNCNPSCPAHRSNPKPRLNVPPTFAEWMQLSEEARTWARARYGARTPPNDVSVAPSETPAVEGGSRDLAAPGGGELAAGSATGPNSSIGDSAFWALAQDEDSKDWFNSDLNMFASSDVTPQPEVHIPPARSVPQNSSSDSSSPSSSPEPPAPKKKVCNLFSPSHFSVTNN